VVLLTDGQPESDMNQKEILAALAPAFRQDGIPITHGSGDPRRRRPGGARASAGLARRRPGGMNAY